jgi:putative nucleotidyltransferase with HDIG domain
MSHLEPILIVDDELAVREIVAAVLAHDGLISAQVSSVAAARAYLRQNPCTPLVLTDLMMPGEDGLALVESIVSDHPTVPAVLLSAMQDVEVVAGAFRRGAFDYIFKPFHREPFLQAVNRALEQSRVRRQSYEYHANLEDMIRHRTAKLRATMADLERSYDITLEAMGDALDLRDQETEGHSKRVTAYTIALARALKVSTEELKTIARGAFLHDIGKIATPDAILLKPGKLTEEEMEVMREHCARGYEIVRKIPFLADAADIVYSHQERFDGTGYPRRLCGEEIPLGARIFAIADTLDAITSDRPYRRGSSFASALQEIAKCAGTQFDPALVASFLELPAATWPEIRSAVTRNSHTTDLLKVA